jgi:NADH:ubiquinone oxidoreductase subunit
MAFTIFPRWKLALERYGAKAAFDKCFAMGTVKFGECVGTDVNGNTYWEDLREKHGQHRWVEYKNLWDYDAAQVPPSWHGWLHHITDEVGPSTDAWLEAKRADHIRLDKTDNTPFPDHVGHYDPTACDTTAGLLTNSTQLKNRGYGVGNLLKTADEPDGYYKQPGSETSDKDMAFKRVKGYEPWDPSDPLGEKADKMGGLRDLSEP